MKSSVELEGFENEIIEVDPRGLFRNASIFINGSPASTKKKGEFVLKRNDGAEVVAKAKQSFFYDAPSIQIEGKTIKIIKPLAWYQYLLSSVLIIFVFLIGEWLIFTLGSELGTGTSFAKGLIVSVIGGLVAAFIGIEFINANIRIFHSKMRQPLKYLAVFAISCALPVLYFPMVWLLFMFCCFN